MKTVNTQETARHAHAGQARRLPGVASARSCSIWSGGQENPGRGSLSTGSRVARAWPPVIVGTEKVLRDAGGPVRRVETVVKMLDGWKVVAQGCAWMSAVCGPRARRPNAISPSPAIQQSDDTHAQTSRNPSDPTKTKNINQKEDNNQASSNRMRDLPEWL